MLLGTAATDGALWRLFSHYITVAQVLLTAPIS
jgi:hypothetical protein